MQNGASILSAHVMPPSEDLTVLGDQCCANWDTTLSGTLLSLFDGSDKTGVLVHCVDDVGVSTVVSRG